MPAGTDANADEAVLRQLYDALARHDARALEAVLAEDVRWEVPSPLPGDGALRDRREVMRWLAAFPPTDHTLRVDGRRALGGSVFEVRGAHLHGAAGTPVRTIPFVHRVEVRDSRVARLAERLPDGVLRAHVELALAERGRRLAG